MYVIKAPLLFPYRLDSYSKETTPLNQIFGGYIRTEGMVRTMTHTSLFLPCPYMTEYWIGSFFHKEYITGKIS
jgi:hypothetical protein